MPRQPEARTVVPIEGGVAGRDIRLDPAAAKAWAAMRQAAAAEGVVLVAVSGFRSVGQQAAIVRRKLAAGQSLSEVLVLSAYPGHSEHHTGRALDLGTRTDASLQESFAATPEFAWLERHAAGFGFFLTYPRGNRAGIAYEPWHWCFRPVTSRRGRASTS